MTKLTADQAAQVRHVLDTAREGRATIAQMGAAHDLAEGAGLTACAGELRGHIREKLEPRYHAIERDLALGIVSGALTHYLVRSL